MLDPQMTLASTALEAVARELEDDPASAGAWAKAEEVLKHYAVPPEEDEELIAAIECQDAEVLGTILAEWLSGDRLRLLCDRGVLKRALKAFRKRIKVSVLAAESSLGGGPMSSGRKSNLVGIAPPERYPLEVWDELVRLGRMTDEKRGLYWLAPGA